MAEVCRFRALSSGCWPLSSATRSVLGWWGFPPQPCRARRSSRWFRVLEIQRGQGTPPVGVEAAGEPLVMVLFLALPALRASDCNGCPQPWVSGQGCNSRNGLAATGCSRPTSHAPRSKPRTMPGAPWRGSLRQLGHWRELGAGAREALRKTALQETYQLFTDLAAQVPGGGGIRGADQHPNLQGAFLGIGDLEDFDPL